MLNLEITIPEEFVDHYYADQFDDALHRLSTDAHLFAGNYEQETAEMLATALKEARLVYAKPICVTCEDIKDAPIIEERKIGEWIKVNNSCTIRCNQCGQEMTSLCDTQLPNYCLNCGADMRGKKND